MDRLAQSSGVVYLVKSGRKFRVKPVSRDEITGAGAGNWHVILSPVKPCLRNGWRYKG